jgi:hypothetical protein
MNVVYVRFDKSLDYKAVVNSFPIKKFLEGVYGEMPTMVTPKGFEFNREQLGDFIQDQYEMSLNYIMETKKVPEKISNEYYETVMNNGGEWGDVLTLNSFEPEVLLDDHIVTVNSREEVLGVFATEDDFGHIIDEMNLVW